MISLKDLILEKSDRPKLIIMAGGSGAGKTYLLNQLSLDSLPLVNPDKFIEDPNHPAYGKLNPGTTAANKEAEEFVNQKRTFVWDTTASNPTKVKDIISKGYSVYMIMVYSHPMQAYISNFFRDSNRNVPASAVFQTWRNVYSLIEKYIKMTKGNFSLFVNVRKEYEDEIKGFNTAAKNGVEGIKDFLQKYNEKHDVGVSSFRDPVELSDQEQQEFEKATSHMDYDRGNYSEDRGLKKYFQDWYSKNGVGPGDDKMSNKLKSIRKQKEDGKKRYDAVLENIAELLYSPVFTSKLVSDTPAEIDQKVQAFLA